MGVPGFFAWLLKKNKEILKLQLKNRPDILYLDSNCFFHPQCFKVLETYTGIDIENEMIKQIIIYMNHIIKFVNPITKVYIAVDGVAPIAKINQQRKRRYKSVIDKEIINNIKLKYGKTIKLNDWTNASITPGTEFMEKLHQEILKVIIDNDRYIYSSYHEPSEGEHKILNHMRKTNLQDKTVVIYGLDSDLIFLSIASNIDNIYLLREGETFNDKENEFVYVDIDDFKMSYYKYIIKNLNTKNYTVNNICNDFVFISYFIGNDFVPNILFLDIRNKGLDSLIKCYIMVLFEINSYLLCDNKINIDFLKRLLYYLSKEEKIYYEKQNKTQYVPICPLTDPMDIEIWTHENIIKPVHDTIQIGKGEPKMWKQRYYMHYFKIDNKNDLDAICKMYVDGLVWIEKYYFSDCPSWSWQYEYHHAPFISDIYDFIIKIEYDLNTIKFNLREPLSEYAQLLAVTPPIYKYLLPEKYAKLLDSDSPIIDLFPQTSMIEIDTLYKTKWWNCIPMLPCINIDRLEKAISDLCV